MLYIYTFDGMNRIKLSQHILDYLVIATGHNDLLPKTKQEKLSQYQTGIIIIFKPSIFFLSNYGSAF